MNHGGTENTEESLRRNSYILWGNDNLSVGGGMLVSEDLTKEIIAAAIEVHRHLGPGLLESAYERCLCHELGARGIVYEQQKPLPLQYKGLSLDCGYRLDLFVENQIVVELKTVEKIMPVHKAQLMTYMKLLHV